MAEMPERFKEIPEEIQERLARCAANFAVETGAPLELITEFMIDLFTIYSDYMDSVDSGVH